MLKSVFINLSTLLSVFVAQPSADVLALNFGPGPDSVRQSSGHALPWSKPEFPAKFV